MPTLLHVDVSPALEGSASRAVSAEFAKRWVKETSGRVIHRDLAIDPAPHLDRETMDAMRMPDELRNASAKEKVALRMRLIEEIKSADELLISTPIWNWSVPSVLKAYIDQVVLMGSLDAHRNKGLAGKKVTFVIAQGGSYSEGSGRQEWDYATGYLQLVAKALGSTDIDIIRVERTLAGSEQKARSIELAKEQVHARFDDCLALASV